MTTITLTYRAIHHKIKSADLPAINWKIVYIFGSLTCLLLIIFYVFSVNRLTQGTYLIKKYNKEISNLSKENKIIETDFAQADFLEQFYSKARELGFEETLKVRYMEIMDASLARAR